MTTLVQNNRNQESYNELVAEVHERFINMTIEDQISPEIIHVLESPYEGGPSVKLVKVPYELKEPSRCGYSIEYESVF